MPELLEIETYRKAAEPIVGRTIAVVDAPDDWYLKGGLGPAEVVSVLPSVTITAAGRIGKLLLLETDGPTIGLRFGMTGRLIINGDAALSDLEYGSNRDNPAWDRFALRFADGGSLVMRDPRRLGGVELNPDVSKLGPDAGLVTLKPFRQILDESGAPLKARLMDQARIAGLGNLLVDESLFRAGLSPERPAKSLQPDEATRLHRAIRQTLKTLGGRGGSHTGDLQPARVRGGLCPKDGEALLRTKVGGRTTYWCPHHQR